MHIQESGEMYLETILMLSRNLPAVRAIDVCEEMGYSKPSVSRAMGLLKKGEFINIDEQGHISLTESGLAVAEKIYKRHRVLTELLKKLGVSAETAVLDACKMEHAISDETYEKIESFISG